MEALLCKKMFRVKCRDCGFKSAEEETQKLAVQAALNDKWEFDTDGWRCRGCKEAAYALPKPPAPPKPAPPENPSRGFWQCNNCLRVGPPDKTVTHVFACQNCGSRRIKFHPPVRTAVDSREYAQATQWGGPAPKMTLEDHNRFPKGRWT